MSLPDPQSWKSRLRFFPATAAKAPRDRGWQQQATNDPELINRWRSETKVLGIATGEPSGVWVVDCDVKDGIVGRDTLYGLERKHGHPFPSTYTVRTPSGGFHLYFKFIAEVCSTIKNAVRWAPGLDVRTSGGLVIAAGSEIPAGRYETTIDAEPAEAPAWLLEEIMDGQEPARGEEKNRPATGHVPEGQRNSTLTSRAGSMRRNGFSQEAITTALLDFNEKECQPPLPESEVRRIAESVAGYEPQPFVENEHLTDLGNAARLARLHGHDVRYSFESNKWYAWNGRCWEVDALGEVFCRAKNVVRALYQEAAAINDSSQREDLVKHAIRSEHAHRIDAMVKLARSERGIAIRAAEFDRDPWLLNLANGTLNLRNDEFFSHRREDLLSKISPVEYDPSASAPVFHLFLDRVTNQQQGLKDYLQRTIGCTLTGDVSENCFFLLWGTGANGKTTLLELMMHTWGQYAQAADFESFMSTSKGRAARNDIARMRGARLVKSVEADEGERFSEALIKQLTGNETVSARFLYQESFDFKPQFKLWLGTNHKPRITGTDDGIWRRVRLIPFQVQIPPAEQDKQLIEKLKAEASGFLNWAIAGLRSWREHGLQEPQIVSHATEGYRESQDVVRRFIRECCSTASLDRCSPQEINDAFRTWLRAEVIEFRGQLKDKLEALGYRQEKTNGRRFWYGIQPTKAGRQGL